MRLAGLAVVVGLYACGGASTQRSPATTPVAVATPVTPDAGEAPATPPVAASPGDAPAPAKVETDDERLIAGVRRAVSEHAGPDAWEAQVGQKALVDTRKGQLLAVLRRVKLVPDEAHADETLDLASADAVMYWRRPVDGEDPHFVGIQLRKDGTHAVFFAILLPP